MLHALRWAFALLCCLAATDALATRISDYRFPEADPIRATVFGTPTALRDERAAEGPLRERTLYLDLDKPGLDRFPAQLRRGYGRLEFSVALQREAAPLVISIAGTGGEHSSGKAQQQKRLLYRAGFHVLSLTSPTNPDWIFAASSSNHAGMTPRDVEDLYDVITRALPMVRERAQVTSVHLTGYSLGALHAAFLAQLDEERGIVGFDRVLMINPPVNLYTSVGNLDRIATIDELESVSGSRQTSDLFDPILRRVAAYVGRTGQIDLTGDGLYRVAQGAELSDFELRALIRVAFGLSVADIVFATDALNEYGYIVGDIETLRRPWNEQGVTLKRALSWGFLDYFELMLLPAWQSTHPEDSREDVIRNFSLTGIQDYLAGADHIAVLHNVDDIILGEGDIGFLEQTFADRAVIYPRGGHCGNMSHTTNVEHMLTFLRSGALP